MSQYFLSSALLSSVARRALVRIAALRRHIDILDAAADRGAILSPTQFQRAISWALAALYKAERQLAAFASKCALQVINSGLPAYAWGATNPATRTQFAANISAALANTSQYEAVLAPSFAEAWDARYSE